MPSFSVTDRAPAAAGNMPVATSASHPPAAAATASNCAATNSAARRGRSAAGRGVAAVRPDQLGLRTGTSGTPTSGSRSAQSCGAHTRTSAPSARNRTASPTSGSTSPRDPCVDNNTRTSRLPFPQVLASAGDSTARPGSCRKSPGALYVESGGECNGTAVLFPDDEPAARSRTLPYQWDAAIGRAMASAAMIIRIDLDAD